MTAPPPHGRRPSPSAPRPGRQRWPRAAALGLALAAGAWLRARHLDDHGLWVDEAITLWAAHGASAAEVTRRALALHPQSPLYYLLTWLFLRVPGESEALVRLPALLCGLALPVLLYRGLAPWGRRAGAAAFVFAVFHPLFVDLSSQARPYTCALLGLALSCEGTCAALRTGGAWARLRAWGGAVLAFYALYLTAPAWAALALAPLALPAARRAYPLGRLLRDGAWAALAAAPGAAHMLSVFARRGELSWVARPSPAEALWAALLPGPLLLLLAGGVWAALRRPRTTPPERGALAFAAAWVVAPLAATALLALGGTNLFTERYLLVPALGASVLAAWVVGRCPRALGALALAAVVASQAAALRPPPAHGWREVGRDLDRLAPAPDEPVLLWQGLIESNLVVRPGRLDDDLRGYLGAALRDQPGAPRRPWSLVFLTSYWGEAVVPGQDAYFERVVAPALEGRRRFYYAGHPAYGELLDRWVRARFPGRFRLDFASPVRPGPLVVLRYARRE